MEHQPHIMPVSIALLFCPFVISNSVHQKSARQHPIPLLLTPNPAKLVLHNSVNRADMNFHHVEILSPLS